MPKVSEEYIYKKKTSIIDTAYQLCLEKPLSAITMQDIITKSGLSQGGIYRFFKNTDEIFTEIIRNIRKEINMINIIDAVFDQNASTPALLLEHIFNLLGDYLEKYLTTFCKIDFEISMLTINEPERVKRILSNIDGTGSFEHLTNRTIAYLYEQTNSGKLHTRIPFDQLAAFISSAFSGIQMQCLCASCYEPQQKALKNSFQPKALIQALKSSVLYLLGENNDETV